MKKIANILLIILLLTMTTSIVYGDSFEQNIELHSGFAEIFDSDGERIVAQFKTYGESDFPLNACYDEILYSNYINNKFSDSNDEDLYIIGLYNAIIYGDDISYPLDVTLMPHFNGIKENSYVKLFRFDEVGLSWEETDIIVSDKIIDFSLNHEDKYYALAVDVSTIEDIKGYESEILKGTDGNGNDLTGEIRIITDLNYFDQYTNRFIFTEYSVDMVMDHDSSINFSNVGLFKVMDLLVDEPVTYPCTVTFDYPKANSGTVCYALHQKHDGEWELLDCNCEEGAITVTFESLSPVILTGNRLTLTSEKQDDEISEELSPITGDKMTEYYILAGIISLILLLFTKKVKHTN